MNTEQNFKRSAASPHDALTIDRYIKNESELQEYLEYLLHNKIGELAIDLEGDQGSVGYKYAVSIIQCFDGKQSAIIDVLQVGNVPILHTFLTCRDFTKIMFSCQNDVFMTQNVLGCTIEPIRDIAVGQKLLGLPINIADHLKIDKAEKDSFQRANWLKRPIHAELLEYAIKDVLLLFVIENEIIAQLSKHNLLDLYYAESAHISTKDFVVDQHRQYVAKFPGYKSLTFKQKQRAATIWIFRELLGERYNCPVGYMLSKKTMNMIVRGDQDQVAMLHTELNRYRSSAKTIDSDLVAHYYQKAILIQKQQFAQRAQAPV